MADLYDLNYADKDMNTWNMLRQTWTAVNKWAEVKLGKVGLTPEKAAVLWLCRDYPEIITPAEIARMLFRENQTVAGLLNRMEKEGLVRRVPKRRGHPYTEVKITDRGRELCGPGVEVYKKLITSFASDLSEEEQKQLKKLLGVIRQKMMDEMHMEPKIPKAYPSDKPLPLNW